MQYLELERMDEILRCAQDDKTASNQIREWESSGEGLQNERFSHSSITEEDAVSSRGEMREYAR
jgi:hypothetical protein